MFLEFVDRGMMILRKIYEKEDIALWGTNNVSGAVVFRSFFEKEEIFFVSNRLI